MKYILEEAVQEIERLRRRNEVLQAQADVVAAFSAALFGPPRPMGMAEDVVFKLRRLLAEQEAKVSK